MRHRTIFLSTKLPSRRFWVKRTAVGGRDGERMCLSQAAAQARLTIEQRGLLVQTIRELFPERVTHSKGNYVIPAFNDHPATRFDHVAKVVAEFERRAS